MMTGCVLDIKRLSVHDGPGIRSTIFLKGCPLNCRWCHNPESISPQREIGLLASKCLGCQACADVCPAGAHSFSDGVHRLDHARCTACGRCVEACLPGALELHGVPMTPAQAAAAVRADRTFYAHSGGGCTLSGGEPLWQADFCAAVGEILRAEQIHCALDTAGAVPWESFARVLPVIDLVLFDLKHTDDSRHREHTGCSNAQILENLARLAEAGVPLEIRIPLIPGFNADAASVAALGEELAGLPHLTGVRLLPYHLARSKREALGRPDLMPGIEPPPPPVVERAARLLQARGLTVLP